MENLLRKLDAAAWYPDSPELRKEFTRQDRFGETYTAYILDTDAKLIGVPRNCASIDLGAPARLNELKLAYSDDYGWEDGFIPRTDEQERLVAASVYTLRDKLGMILEAPTGYGKTYLGSAVIQRMGQRACVITTKEDIVKDWRKALSSVLRIPEERIGVWRGDTLPTEDHEVVVALVQSVCKGPPRYPKELYEGFGLVLIDEVHRMGAEEFSKAMWHFPARYRVGLSATPYRKDGREPVFTGHIGDVEVAAKTKGLPFKVICVNTRWKPPEVWQYDPVLKKNVFGKLEIPWGRAIIGVKYFQDDEYRNSLITMFVNSALNKDRNIVIFSDTVEHLSIIRETLIQTLGLPDTQDMFGYYVGLSNSVYLLPDTKDRYTGYREDLREKAKNARICLATCQMASYATNVPWWDTAVLATPKADVAQLVGRIRREWPDKQFPTVLDLCDYGNKVYATFARSRQKWYHEQGAEVILK